MTVFKNFIQDFPIRCGEILAGYKDQAKESGRDVTHMLSIASAALTIPFERLRKTPNGIMHPSRDKLKYKQADGKFANLCDRNFLQSTIWSAEPKSWKIGDIKAEDVKQPPDEWVDDCESLPSDIKVIKILIHLRNAIAHGNIYTEPNPVDEIVNIIFLSKIMDENNKFTGIYKMLKVSPKDFNEFLVKWIGFLKKELNLPATVD